MDTTSLSIMYSGGLDSYIAYHYALSLGYKPQCINVNLGHPYSGKEMDVIRVQQNGPGPDGIVFLNLKSLYPAIERRLTNQIIPARNLLLATIGAMFNSRVWIHALDGEQNGKEHDKSERFFDDSTKLLTFLNEFFQKETIVESPFAKMTKAETVTWALQHGIKVEDLFSTTSCYSGDKIKCGKCLTCFKRWTAFKLNGIEEPGYEFHPLDSDYFKELLVEMPKARYTHDYSRFTEKRIDEFESLLKLLSNDGHSCINK